MASNTLISTEISTSDDKKLNVDEECDGDKKSNDIKRPKLPALQTPVSASYPSALRSPLVGTPGFVKKEDGIKTPITPPVAYLDFLKSMSTGLMSPATGTSSKFSFGEKTSEKSFDESLEKSTCTTESQPALSRTASTDSAASASTIGTTSSASSTSTEDVLRTTSGNSDRTKPQSPRIVIPPTQFAKPLSAKLPRGVYIPQSPLSPANTRSPMSARSLHEPYSASGLSATPWSADYSPVEADGTSRKSRVSVRQVVTRTVTYARTPLEPAPKGKRRKLEE